MNKNVHNRTFVISDTHFSHQNILSFTDGKKPLRPFDTMEEMNEFMIEKWNSVVTENDTVIHLGDIVFAQTGFECLGKLNGKKIALMGNHERHKLSKYLEYFSDIRAYKEYNDMILCHIPVHESQLIRYTSCVHGHLHTKKVMLPYPDHEIIDPRYFCVSVEQINYTPILLDEVRETFKKRGVL